MSLLAPIILVMLLIVGLAFLRGVLGYRGRDLLILGFMLSSALFLGRWNEGFYFFLLGRPYMGIGFLVAGWAVVFLLLVACTEWKPNLSMQGIAIIVGIILLTGLLSGMLNAPSSRGIGNPLHAQAIWVLPLLAAYLAAKALPPDVESHEKFQTSYILVYGLLLSSIVIVSALFWRWLTPIFGWERQFAEGGAGFARGWSPLGGPITTGIFLVAGYALCLGRVLRKKAVLVHGLIAALCALAVLFTLSRSVLLAMVVLHLVTFRRLLMRNLGRTVLVGLVVLMIGGTVVFLSQRFNFERIVSTGEIDLRFHSVFASLELFAQSPILGHGPGVLFSDVRVPDLLRESRGSSAIVIGSYFSAKEPHNMYLLFLTEYGLLGLGLLLTMLGIWVHHLRVARDLALADPDREPAANVLWGMAIALMVFGLTWSSMFLYPQASVAAWLFVTLSLHHVAVVRQRAYEADWPAEEELEAFEEPALEYGQA